jgi:tetratricopeptide (TPR) repeat protein
MKIPSLLLIGVAALLPLLQMRAATLDDAHRAFAAGNFQMSTQDYEAVLAQQGYSAPVLFDLGNSYYREGNLAQAILAYKRAQWLSPNDPDIAANLGLAEKKAGVAETESGWSGKISRFLSASGWAWLACGAWTLLCASLLARLAVSGLRPLIFASSLASVVVFLISIAATWISSRELREAVVVEKNASALISPFPAAQAVFSPAPGETVTVQKSYDDFLLVTDRSGRSGWIGKAQLSPIIPPQTGESAPPKSAG